MKITDIDVMHLNPALAARNVDHKARFSGIDTQTLYKVVTDNGVTGQRIEVVDGSSPV